MQGTEVLGLFSKRKTYLFKTRRKYQRYIKSYQLSKQWWVARLRWYSDRHYNKVDKVSGERLINADEIVKLSNQSQTQETKT
jgi:hypothetical protein